jgi:hypothetical protein
VKIHLGILLLLSVSTILYADFLKSRTVGPGIQHHHEYRTVGPWHVHILEIDCTSDWNEIKTAKAHHQLAARARTSFMTSHSDIPNQRVIGAINGDFYDRDGIPIGTQVIEGLLLKRPIPRSVFGITTSHSPFIDIVSYAGSILTPAGNTYQIDGINQAGTENSLILYNSFDNQYSDTISAPTQIRCRIISEQTAINHPLTAVVENYGADIIQNGFLLTGMGSGASFLKDHIQSGDTLIVLNNLKPINEGITELVGGTPRLIRNGQASVEWIQENVSKSFTYNRHPRTAVGINSDGTRIYFFTVDGRQNGYSVGMSLFELAGYMLSWGIEEGINLDGGGSTTMVVHDKVINSPSDITGERPVSNALMVVGTLPEGPLERIGIYPDDVYTAYNSTIPFQADAFDAHDMPLEVKAKHLKWKIDPQIGTIDGNGLFTSGEMKGGGFVYVQMDSIRDSTRVVITDAHTVTLSPESLSLDLNRKYPFRAFARDQSGNPITVSQNNFEWMVSDTICSINDSGLFHASHLGKVFVIATYSAVAGSASVRIQIPETQH